jgi:hypothetical protein
MQIAGPDTRRDDLNGKAMTQSVPEAMTAPKTTDLRDQDLLKIRGVTCSRRRSFPSRVGSEVPRSLGPSLTLLATDAPKDQHRGRGNRPRVVDMGWRRYDNISRLSDIPPKSFKFPSGSPISAAK